MLINLSEIMSVPNGVKADMIPIELKTFLLHGVEYTLVHKEPVDLRLTNLGSRKVLVEAKTSLALAVPCARCLEEVIIPKEIELAVEVDFTKSEKQRTEDLDETNYVTGYELDVDKLIYEEVLIDFPMKVLCKDDCRGICNVCGANQNVGECDCDHTQLDPRMAAIRDIFNKFKEV